MKFIVYLLTLLFVGTAVAQNPTILQGSYISNVFGNSNFVLNPNAQTNVANVTNATRSTTTPLVATSEFNLNLTNGTFATWTLRAFDSGMKGQNCEARFTYRGFATATTKAEIVQNSLVVATLTLTPSTDPRIASINFPCGDLVNATTFRIAQTTANMTTVTPNEIGGIYVGLATNMANVAQAEEVGSYTVPGTTNCTWSGNSTTGLANFAADADCPTGTVTGAADTSAGKIPGVKFNNLKPGKYMFIAQHTGQRIGAVADSVFLKLTDGTTGSAGLNIANSTTGDIQTPVTHVLTTEYTTITSPTVQVQGAVNNGTNSVLIPNGYPIYGFKITAYRFPSSSELVVTPERQNVWASAEWNNADLFQYFGVAEPTGFLPYTRSGSFTAVYNGNAQAPLSATEVGFSVPNLPVGKYEVRINQGLRAAPGVTSGNGVVCDFRVRETTTNTPVGLAEQTTERDASLSLNILGDNNVVGIFNNTSTGTRNFIYEASKIFDSNATNNGQCGLQTTVLQSRPVVFTLIPLDQPSNSALYVQGPVLGAQTGAAIPSGYVGQRIDSDTIIGTAIGTTVTYAKKAGGTDAVLTLPPGTWQIHANFQSLVTSGATLNNFSYVTWSIRNDTDAATLADTVRITYAKTPAAVAFSNYTPVALSTTVNLTSTKNFKLAGTRIDGAGVGDATLDVAGSWTAQFYAIRLN